MGRPYIVTPEWLDELRKWNARDKANTWVWLAGKVGCDPSTFTKMLSNPEQFKSSDLIEDICRWAKIPLPHNYSLVDIAEDESIRALLEFKRRDPDRYEALEKLAGIEPKKP